MEWWDALVDFFATYRVAFQVLVIVVVALLANWVLRIVLDRSVRGVVRGVKRSQAVDSTQELQAAPHLNARAIQRTRTLGTVGRHIISWTIVVVATLAILSQIGVNITAMLASAGIIAAGLAFGAQNIVKDILNGIFMVFEDQLGVGDIVTIGQVSGTVEDVGIRITKVRAMDGTLWFIRNGEIFTLGNASQGWGQAVVDIVVAADTDLDAATEAALACGRELISSPEWVRRVTGEPEMLGLEALAGDRATLRLLVRTRPEAQWAVQRELRARIKDRYAELGIELAAQLPKFPGGSM